MDASTSSGGGAEERDNSANKYADTETAEFSPGFKDVDAFVKVSERFSVSLCSFRPCYGDILVV